MKTIAFAALMILASASALPQPSDVQSRRDVVEVILNVVERVRDRIKAKYDPYVLDRAETGIEIEGIIKAFAFVENLEFTGASNIVVNDIGHSLITDKLTFDVSIPEIQGSIGGAGAGFAVLGRPVNEAIASGRLAIVDIGIAGELNVKVDSTQRVTISDLVVEARLGGIQSGIHLNLLGWDVSGYINNFLGNTLPTVLNNNADIINRGLARAIMFLLDRVIP